MLRKYSAHNSLLPIFISWQIDPEDFNYNINFSYQFPDASNIDLIIAKLQELINLKPYLRQTFFLEKNILMACIHDYLPAEINFFTSSTTGFLELEQELTKEVHDISANSSIKLNIIRFDDKNDFIILFNIHYIIMDSLSLSHFIRELNSLLSGEKIIFESTEEYIEKIGRETPLKSVDSYPELEEYIKEVREIAVELNYPPRNKEILFHTEFLPNEIMDKLVGFSAHHQINKYNLMLLAWGVFIAKLFNQIYTLISYPVNIRSDKSIDGCLSNTVIIPINFSLNHSYFLLIHDFKKKMDILKKAEKTNFGETLNISEISSFINENVGHDNLIIQDQCYVMKKYPRIEKSNLSIRFIEKERTCYFICEGCSNLFPKFFYSSLLSRFFIFLNKILEDPSKIFPTIDLTFTEEKNKLLYNFNDTTYFYQKEKNLVDLFEEQVIKTPDNIAFVYKDIKFTYACLNEKVNQLAHLLRDCFQIKSDDLIVLLLDRNESMIICILGVLKSGAAYVPLDPNLPEDRISYILDDTRANVVITDEISKYKLKFNKKNRNELIVNSQETQIIFNKQSKNNPLKLKTDNNLAYVIYTSGTTGIPKGVMIEHKNVINTIFSIAKIYKIKNSRIKSVIKIAAFASYAFDVSVGEFFVSLLNGHELYILSNATKQDATKISEYLNSFKINYIFLPPVMLANLPKIAYPSLQGILYAGEPCDVQTGLYWSQKCKLYNYYGPTETSIYTTGLQIKNGEVNLIGKPIANTTAYVLDNYLNPLPIGIIGELYIGGMGLGRGYLHRIELTSEKFIANPFQTKEEGKIGINSRLYKTGDLARWLPDGNLEYIGRNDFQVKIRGYRIELGEIEAILIHHPDIQQVIALVKHHWVDNKDDKFIAAYYTSKQKIEESYLYDYCKNKLPDYMIPSIFIHLNKIPLTINGKIDKKSLPEPKFENIENYVEPESENERLICSEFSKILGLKRAGANDNFFKIGGNSITAINLVVHLQVNYHININISDVYNLKTPRNIAKKIFLDKKDLNKHLENIKNLYLTEHRATKTSQSLLNKFKQYKYSILHISQIYQKKSFSTVLLTGGTGFLGCNLLNEILKNTNCRVFLLVRSKSPHFAYKRINKKFQFYFDQSLDSIYNKRVFVFSSDIEKNCLSLSPSDYQTLVQQVDSIIHSAAITKHYGEPDEFYSTNVQSTQNLLELCKLTRLKDFHYISTVSVFDEDFPTNHDQNIVTEDDEPDEKNLSNIYAKTKCQGEKIVIKYREHGITSNIYRVGNLAFIAKNSRTQENIQDNAFLNQTKCLLNMGIIAKEISQVEISPVDLVAEAIIKLFDKSELANQTYHVFNPNTFDLATFFSSHKFLNVKIVSINQFVNSVLEKLKDPNQRALVEKFLVHQGWLNENFNPLATQKILQDRTDAILQRLGFTWMPIDEETFIKCLV